MKLFYKIHLQAFNVISSVLYHSGPTFGKVLYSCLDVFVVDASDTQVTSLNTSSMLLKRFPWSGFFIFGKKPKSGGLSPPDFGFFPKLKKPLLDKRFRIIGGLSPPNFDLFPKLKKPLRGKRFRSIEEVSNEVT
jgi:hypothetical protein